MRFSPTKLLHGLLCTTPILVLTLAACGGGGGGGTSTPPLAAAYKVGGAVSGVTAAGLVLRNNGGDDKAISSVDASYTFGTSVIAGTSYNITVLSNPSNLKCSVDPLYASGVMPASPVTKADVSCVTAYPINVILTGLNGGAVLLQNNGNDNLLLSANGTYTFSTPVADNTGYSVSVLAQPDSPAQSCTFNTYPTFGTVSGASASVSINCVANPSPAVDKYAYVANYGSNNVSAYTINAGSGVLATVTPSTIATGAGPSAVAVDPSGQFAYVTNENANSVSAYNINSGTGALTPLTDVDAGTYGTQTSIATGSTPVSIKIHPSGKFAYVVNSLSNSVSAYSIDASGALASIDTDKLTPGTQTSIPTKSSPVSIAIHPGGGYAYVANAGKSGTDCPIGCVSVYSIDATTGALTAIDADGQFTISTNTFVAAGTTPYSVTVDPTGKYAYVANGGSGDVTIYSISAIGNADEGTLSSTLPAVAAGIGPRSVVVNRTGQFAYVVNSGSNDISAYLINPFTGALLQVDCGGGPGCDTVNSLPTNFTAGTNPKSIRIDSSGKYAYVANYGSNDIWVYGINTGNGVLTALGITGTGAHPSLVTTAP